MEYLQLLFKRSKKFYALLVLLGTAKGVLYMGLLMFINHVITGKPLPTGAGQEWWLFTGLVGLAVFTARLFQTYMVVLTTDVNFDLELAILKKLRYCSYEEFEKLGNETVFTAINDIRVLGNLPEIFMNAINACILILCCFVYLFTVSLSGAAAILVLMIALVTFYSLRNAAIEKKLNLLRNLQNGYFQYLNDLLLGFRELKMSPVRNRSIHADFLEKNRLEARSLRLSTSIAYMNNELIGNYSWYVVLGFIMFALPVLFGVNVADVSAFLVTILYLIGPVAVLVTLLPTYMNVKIALERLGRFNRTMDASLTGGPATDGAVRAAAFESVRFEGVTYQYTDQKNGKTFALGPVDVEIRKGEVVYVAGGNGSGKSTFVKLLTGLYKPAGGFIAVNGSRLEQDDYAQYVSQLSAIFTDNYLFSENYDGFPINRENEKLLGYIQAMKLTGIVQFNEEKNMLDRNLSKGQQKRLALIYALLEDKPVLVLDEWAAEQDPAFRAYFYQSFLPELKRMGKTVIAITHDDEYFPCADRIIKFNFGTIASDETKAALLTPDYAT